MPRKTISLKPDTIKQVEDLMILSGHSFSSQVDLDLGRYYSGEFLDMDKKLLEFGKFLFSEERLKKFIEKTEIDGVIVNILPDNVKTFFQKVTLDDVAEFRAKCQRKKDSSHNS